MIQRMGRAGRKGGQSTFVLFTPKWSAIKDQKEIEERKTKKSNTVKPNNATQQASPLCQVSNATQEDEGSDNEWVAESTACSVADSEAEAFDIEDANLFGELIITDADKSQQKRKKQRQSSKTDAPKRARLPDELFDYIHVAGCRRLFSLAWYGDTTYANIDQNPLPSSCCNGSTCKSQEPDYFQREAFIDDTPTKYTENDREWIACRTAALKKWRQNTSIWLWNSMGVIEQMPDNALMSDSCLLALAKDGGQLNMTYLRSSDF